MKKNSRKRRILVAAALAAFAAMALRFVFWRSADRDAWPSPAPEISREPVSQTAPGALEGAAAARLAAALPPPEGAPAAAYRTFQRDGFAALSEPDRAAIAARAANPGWAALDAALSSGFVPGADGPTEGAAGLVARSSEAAVLAAWAAHLEGGSGGPDAARLAASAGRALAAFSRGAGIPGVSAALSSVALFSREASMAACDPASAGFGPEKAAAAIGGFREAEALAADVPLGDAVRDDWRAARAAVVSVYGQMEGRVSPLPGAKSPGRTTTWVVRALGGSEETTLAHVDALFSRLAANADAPFSAGGFVAGLPRWCREGGRPPWTRDPIGASIAQGYLRHARYAAALVPAMELELRAARVAIALRAWRDAAGDWPESLAPLFSGDESRGIAPLLVPSDAEDPFAADGSVLRYARDADGWRMWSVGTDGGDDGGALDAFSAGGDAAGEKSDFVFTSRERDIRRAAGNASRNR